MSIVVPVMEPRPARLWHLPRLAVILWRFTRATPWLPQVRTRREDLTTFVKVIRWGWVRVLKDGRGVAGFIVRDGRRIHALYVHPDRRNRGIGRALLAEAKAEAQALDLWVLEANTGAQAFYAANGFIEYGRSPGYGNDENLPDILMVWTSEKGAIQ
ncbi:Ribosomal protein S18 acetylase RimI [Roseovarius lutimaris]|uniref:Ribosomal protein S18 acetylase RimI n=1 Tax=Roseovarius lutimaris TaxID=1005928 RepID=A0A1I5BMW5_9RHOB|nr:GNAT family N-acetyltransferase [Roseovarius lutimaris]SFN75966.1 Ribosomal protein S18 acetylase RimI [Roseovarius lutimaris]